MVQGSRSWLREVTKMFLKYLAVGAAFVPWGVLYSLLVFAGWGHWVIAVLMLGGGFATAHFAWTALEKRMRVQLVEISPPTTPVASGGAVMDRYVHKVIWPAPVMFPGAGLAFPTVDLPRTQLLQPTAVAHPPREFKFLEAEAEPLGSVIISFESSHPTATGSSQTVLLTADVYAIPSD